MDKKENKTLDAPRKLNEMTPKEIVLELDKYIIGQDKAKKSVAVALRNRYRRNLLDAKIKEEITPKNILMLGPTGCGKTEIARRLAKLMDAPFVKVEATKFTEVGYVGRDVETMVRDLAEASVRITKQKKIKEKEIQAREVAIKRVAHAIVPGKMKPNNDSTDSSSNPFDYIMKATQNMSQGKPVPNPPEEPQEEEPDENLKLTREQVMEQVREGKLDDQIVEIKITEKGRGSSFDMGNGEPVIIGNIFGQEQKRKKTRKMTVKEAVKQITEEEAVNMIDMDQIINEAIENAEQNGIIFIDEIDKIAQGDLISRGQVSREGVQRDILPIVEGSVVNTKYGPLRTDHVLFIGAGAFHVAKPTDLIPELQGRFPIRVELESLDEETFYKILTIPKNALVTQHKLLLETEGVKVDFKDDAIKEIARMAFITNEQTENIGARRLHTIMEKLMEDISFNITEEKGDTIVIDREYVDSKFLDRIKSEDVGKYIL